MLIDERAAGELLLQADGILILTHQSPDGDTLGSGFALWHALHKLGKRAKVVCPDPIPKRFSYMMEGYTPAEGELPLTAAVDLADLQLLGGLAEQYSAPGAVDLCMDHHPSNTHYAKNLLLRDGEAAACQIIFDVIKAMGVEITPEIAACLYTGISTDTGGFRFSNTQIRTHQIAAELMKTGIDCGKINRLMYETKSRQQLAVEALAIGTLQYAAEGKISLLYVTNDMLKKSGASYEDTDGLASVARSVEGVEVGITLKEREEGGFKVSMRSGSMADVSKICRKFGGGGHKRAAGCLLKTSLEEAIEKTIQAAQEALAHGQG